MNGTSDRCIERKRCLHEPRWVAKGHHVAKLELVVLGSGSRGRLLSALLGWLTHASNAESAILLKNTCECCEICSKDESLVALCARITYDLNERNRQPEKKGGRGEWNACLYQGCGRHQTAWRRPFQRASAGFSNQSDHSEKDGCQHSALVKNAILASTHLGKLCVRGKLRTIA